MNESSNFDNLTTSSEILYEYLYGDSFSRIIYYFGIAIVLLLGPLSCTAIVLYERFGADSQKRTIINRLSSLFFTNIAIQSIIWSILRILRDSLGLLPTHLITPVILVSHSIKLSTMLFITEITVLRFMYIVVWKRMRTLNDDFWGIVLAISTYLVAIYLAISVFLTRNNTYNMGNVVALTNYEETRYNTS